MNDQVNHHPHPQPVAAQDGSRRRLGPRPDGHAATVVLDVSGLQWASQQRAVEVSLRRRPGVLDVHANTVAQTATVTFDANQTSLAQLRGWVQDCGYHCSGQSVPSHLCNPMSELEPAGVADEARPVAGGQHPDHAHQAARENTPEVITSGHDGGHDGGHERRPPADAAHDGDRSPHEVMGHGGQGGMSMDSMVRDMRNRFLVAALFAVPILLWSPIGRDVFGVDVAVPFGLRVDVWSLLLSLPVIVYADSIFFDGAVRALQARTLDMMVLVAVAVGAGWLYSLVVTFTGGGDVFYEAATVLSAFVLLGHWFEMRARGGPTKPSAPY